MSFLEDNNNASYREMSLQVTHANCNLCTKIDLCRWLQSTFQICHYTVKKAHFYSCHKQTFSRLIFTLYKSSASTWYKLKTKRWLRPVFSSFIMMRISHFCSWADSSLSSRPSARCTRCLSLLACPVATSSSRLLTSWIISVPWSGQRGFKMKKAVEAKSPASWHSHNIFTYSWCPVA